MVKPWAIVAVVAAISAAPVHAQMYKCVDERGVTHYTDKPGPGCKGGPVDIRPAPPISGKVEERKEDLVGAEREFQRRQIEREYQRLTSGRRLGRTNEKGERVYVEDAERQRRAAQLKGDLARQCPF